MIDVSWTVVNQGEAAAGGIWVNSVYLVPLSGAAVSLGSFAYDRTLESGIRYTRTEQVRLPRQDRRALPHQSGDQCRSSPDGNQVYEHGLARDNNTLLSPETTEVSLNDRPDLRITNVIVPEHVTAGTSAAIRYTVSDQGAAASSGRWQDKVFLSLDAALSADDTLVGQFDSGSALAPSESYANETAAVNIPIRYRGNAYLIVVADGNNSLDEYPNEANNVRAAQFYVNPVPFADLVTRNVVAPDQAVHGSSIEVRYTVSNLGSATTRGDSAAISSWTDSVWLTTNKGRPGGTLLGSITHSGKLAVGEDYLGTLNVGIPDTVLSGNYYLTVWSDTYNVILEDTLASNINPGRSKPGWNNNNYKARPISILGITPPDLTVLDVQAPEAVNAGGAYSFSYTVQNRGDAFSGQWTDSVT